MIDHGPEGLPTGCWNGLEENPPRRVFCCPMKSWLLPGITQEMSMRWIMPILLTAVTVALNACSLPADQRLVGSWEGTRPNVANCQPLSWKTTFTADNRFATGFFRDAAWQQFIHMEYGYWAAANGKRVLKTDGVKDAEIYEYKVIDADTVSYVSTAWDATADCQEHYAFTEHRMSVRKKAASTPY